MPFLIPNRTKIFFTNSSSSIGFLERFNFSLDEAALELENYLSQDRLFDKFTEHAIIYFYALLIISGVCSNAMVTGIIINNTRVCSSRYPFVINLNVSDLILCLFCMPFSLLALIHRNWPLGTFLCKVVPFIQGSTVYVSSATVSVIAVDRQRNVINVFPKIREKNKTRVLSTVAAIWIVSFVLSSPVSIAQTVTSVGLPGIYIYEKCIEQWPWAHAKGIYTVVTLLVQFVIPAIVLLVTHFRIESHLKFNISRCKDKVLPSQPDCAKKALLRNRRATLILLVISIVFCFTWMPWNILNLVADFYPTSMSPQNLYLAFVICHMLAMTSATSNPILYGWLNSNIRKELLKVGEKITSTLIPHRSTNSDNVLENYANICIGHSNIELEHAKTQD